MEILETHNRFKGLPWYSNKEEISILGAGGIGSWLSLALSRQGHTLHITDFDKVELHNLGGQLFSIKDIGNNKAYSVSNMLKYLTPENSNNLFSYDQKITEDEGIIAQVCFSCFDNMASRKLAFVRWVEECKASEDDKLKVFIDGRLLAEEFQIYTVKYNEVDIDRYVKTLFNDDEIPDEDCTAKATSHCSMMIASLMTASLNNLSSNYYSKMDIRDTPFVIKASLPMMFFEFKN
jgi:molybdopterin/thiamine biosynthesis adenylyltransferase